MARRKKSKNNIIIILVLILTLIVSAFIVVKVARYTYSKNVANEHFTEQDTYKMSVYSEENSTKALKALRDKDVDDLKELLIDDTHAEELINYADWSEINLEKTRTLGGGSYMSEPDSNGRMDFGEMYWVKTGNKKYIMYIQTVCSRYGKANDGIQAIAVTTEDHYEAIDWEWEWQEDDKTLIAGSPYPGWE